VTAAHCCDGVLKSVDGVASLLTWTDFDIIAGSVEAGIEVA
jgi:hypothetical protein